MRTAAENRKPAFPLAPKTAARGGDLVDRRRFRTFFDPLPDYVYLKDRDNRLLAVNAAFEREFGTAEDACSLWGDCFPLSAECRSEDGRAMDAGGPQDAALRQVRTSRGHRWLYLSRFPYADGAGRVVGLIVHGREADQLAQARAEYRMLLDYATDAMFLHDLSGRFLEVNRTACERLGYTREELLRLTPADIDAPEYAALVPERLEQLRREGELVAESAHRTKDGRTIPVEIAARVVSFHGQPAIFSVARDIGPRKALEQALRQALDAAQAEARLLSQVFEHSLEGITITDAQATILRVNPAFTAITGYAAEEAVGRNPRILKSDRHSPEFYAAMWRALREKGSWSGEIWNRRKSGEAYPEWLSIGAAPGPAGRPGHYLAVFHDLSEFKEKEERLRIQAYYDGLTGLPNRTLLRDRLEVALSQAGRENGRLALLHLDLDDFKTVNDSLGRLAGDALIQEVAGRIRESMREADSVSRLGGDEFAVLLNPVRDARDAMRVAERVQQAWSAPVRIQDLEIHASASMGVALFPDDGKDPETLLRNAELAMYRAKAAGRNQCRLFQPEMNAAVSRRLTLEARLRKALERDEFVVHYQPKVALRSGRIVGMEALARWEDRGATVSPAEFIPLAEETGLILPLGEAVLEKACRQAGSLAAMGRERLTVAVNLSPRQFRQPDLVEQVARILAATGLDPGLLELEITETSIMDGIEEAVKKLHLFQEMGIAISVDDFGTGYSSLSYLKHFPIQELKVDRSFIRDLTRNPEDKSIVAAVVALARSFSLTVVAEGVERLDQLEAVRGLGCDQVQGFIFTRPLPGAAFRAFLEAWRGGRR